MSTRLLLIALPPIALLLIASLLVQLMVERDQEAVDQKAAERLTLYRQTILGEYEKYRYLPYMLARDPRATVVLNMGRPTESANRFLEEVAEKSGADLLFLMDRQGRTLASSNWRDELSLVGQSYAYRPYFHTALTGNEGQFFAIGATLGEPGLFLSLPSPVSGEPDGVAVVKVDMEPLEQAWAKGGETVFASDANGVIFLASVADWRYRTLQELSDEVRSQITATRQYADQPLAALSQNPLGNEKVVAVDGRTYRHNSAQVGLLGWTLHFLVPIEETRKNIWPIWASAIGLSLLYFVGLLVQRGRVLRRASARLRKESQGLRELNQRLVDEVDERRRVEEELRNAQRRLARSSRLAAVGQMSAAVAHELNQPLAALRMFVAGARKFLESGNVLAVEDNLKEIDSLQHRMATLTQELKRFARPAESRIEMVDLKNCISAAEKIARSRFEEDGVNLHQRLPDGPLKLETAPLKVEQVLVNLLRNGADSAAKVEDGEVILEVDRKVGSVVVSVSDNGAGVPSDLREKIFDPFFTTKLSNGGLGLGLSISDRIAEDLGGSLQVKPNATGGATFLFTLPAPEGAVRDRTLEAETAVLELETE
ncbi:ATP-binding protein [Labrenzia sp. CE80]|uniref:sensor histidine kinase n=1 Tax=Labrenzia sp. CE80 TaxID=1788986 RepID=UPI00129B14DD|nr:ATP-binding protein [Labrenzia sp. CE80]